MAISLLIILFFSVAGYFFPTEFSLLKPHINSLLSIILFMMGITLTIADFKRVASQWKLVLLGTGLQFITMPILAIAISSILGLPTALTVGMVLVGVCPGGTASNVMVFLGKGNVPLSITLTLFSTIISPFATPFLLQILLNHEVEVDLFSMFFSILQIVILPIGLGITLHYFFEKLTTKLMAYASNVSSIGIALIIACVIALNRPNLEAFPLVVFLGVALHNGLGFTLGYWGARLFTTSTTDAKTISIEVGMQNSGLAISLAQQFFSNYALATLPGAIFSLWHNLSGILLSYLYRQKKR